MSHSFVNLWPIAHQAPLLGISQSRILEGVAIAFSRVFFRPRDRTCMSCIGRWILYHQATREAPKLELDSSGIAENRCQYGRRVRWESPVKESGSCSVVSDSLRPHGLYSLWNSPGQHTEVGSLSFLQGIFPRQNQTEVSCIEGSFQRASTTSFV